MNKTRLAGWILSGLLAAFLLFSASGKFRDFPNKAEMFEKFGWSEEAMQKVGVVEIACTIFYLVPQTSFLGSILLTGYLGGATATHMRIGDPVFFPPILGVVMWVGYALRRPDVVLRAFHAPGSGEAQS